MKIRKAYKFRLKPSSAQIELMAKFAGHTRFLWNKALALNINRLRKKQRILYYQELDFWSKLWKQSDEYGFLAECPAHILQQKLRDLERAFKDCFSKTQPNKRLPRFKKRDRHDSFRFPAPQQIKLSHRHITFPKLGRMRFYRSREIIGDIKNYTISRQAGKWFVSIQVEMEHTPQRDTLGQTAVGLDMGIKHFVTMSTGEHKAPVNSFRQHEKVLGRLQRRLSRKKRYSSNWKKANARINKLHHKIANIRGDFHHKLSTYLCKNHAMIVIEDLKIKNMSKSAKGNLDNPGKHVSAKSGLNKSILDQGWYSFRRYLEYKSLWAGGMVVAVNPRYTSQQCAHCGHKDPNNRQTQADFVCLRCDAHLNADVNAARNILAAGHAVMACGASA